MISSFYSYACQPVSIIHPVKGGVFLRLHRIVALNDLARDNIGCTWSFSSK
jgi:hypothetical protein